MFQVAQSQNRFICLAEQFDFKLLHHDNKYKFFRFQRDEFRIDLWYTKMTVGIYREHEKAFFHHDVTEEGFVELLSNPMFDYASYSAKKEVKNCKLPF